MNPLKQLQDFGQSVWLDNIHRGMLRSGELKKLIDEDGLRGLTSNPAIFQKALASGQDYDEDVRRGVREGLSDAALFDRLAVADIRSAADLFRPLFDQTGGQHGHVSLEVSPHLARDVQATVAEAERLWKLVDRPNLMVKIPATAEGVQAVEKTLSKGINVNVTLIFSVERHRQVMAAYRRALEAREKAGLSLDVSSVASFFVSRIDTAVDKMLQEKIQASQSGREKDLLLELIGKIAVANAKVAYQAFKEFFAQPWFYALKDKGARTQRPLWASTGTKNPHYSDVLYVETLIGPDTINTLPPATMDAFRDHGKAAAALEGDVALAGETLGRLGLAHIDLDAVTGRLEKEGVQLFIDAHDQLMRGLAEKRRGIEKAPAGTR